MAGHTHWVLERSHHQQHGTIRTPWIERDGEELPRLSPGVGCDSTAQGNKVTYCLLSILLYSVYGITFQHALLSYQYLKRTRKNVVTENHNASYWGLGQDGPRRSCPNPGGPVCRTCSLSKRGRFLTKVRNVAQFKPSSLLEW